MMKDALQNLVHYFVSHRDKPFAVLDIGSSKVACAIGRKARGSIRGQFEGNINDIELLGVGQCRSNGVRHGVVVNSEQTEQAILRAVESAERTAHVSIDSMIVSINGGDLRSETLRAGFPLHGRNVSHNDIVRVLRAACERSRRNMREVVHALPIGYSLDGITDIYDPKGMAGEQLQVDTHLISVHQTPVRNLEMCLGRCHIRPVAFVSSALASSLCVLTRDEMEMGAVCIDMGAAMTSVGV